MRFKLKIDVRISRDDITPEINRLKTKLRSSNMRSFLRTQEGILKNNVNQAFRSQIYFDGTTKAWDDLKPSTVERRTRRGTWSGSMSDSILKEFYYLRNSISSGKFSVGSSGGVYHISLYPTGRHRMSSISIQGLALLHQEGTADMVARPPYSWLPRYQDILVANFKRYMFS